MMRADKGSDSPLIGSTRHNPSSVGGRQIMAARQSITSKLCSKCREVKPCDRFYVNRGKSGDLSSWCKACIDIDVRKRVEVKVATRYRARRVAAGLIGPDTQILDAEGRDWAWAYVVFRGLDEWPGYLFGSDGSPWCCRVRGGGKGRLSDRWNPVKPQRNTFGYLHINLSRGTGKQYTKALHLLVLEAFLGPCPPGMEGCHNDNNRANCNIRNLRWDTRKNNHADKRIHGTLAQGSRVGTAKLSETDVPLIRVLAASGFSKTEIGRRFGVSRSAIARILKGETWDHVAEF